MGVPDIHTANQYGFRNKKKMNCRVGSSISNCPYEKLNISDRMIKHYLTGNM